MSTPKKHNILSMEPGGYIHFDIKRIISSLLRSHEFDFFGISDFKLGVNVGGLPISKVLRANFGHF